MYILLCINAYAKTIFNKVCYAILLLEFDVMEEILSYMENKCDAKVLIMKRNA